MLISPRLGISLSLKADNSAQPRKDKTLKKILIYPFMFSLLAMALLVPPIDAQASGFHDILNNGQTDAQIGANPYEGDITNIMAIASIDDRSLLNPAEPEKVAIAAAFHGSTAIMAAKALALKGGGFFGTGTEPRSII